MSGSALLVDSTVVGNGTVEVADFAIGVAAFFLHPMGIDKATIASRNLLTMAPERTEHIKP
jgi:hypothetical protein